MGRALASADGGEVVGLVGWGERLKGGQGVERGPVDHDRLGVDRPSMDNAVADPHNLQARTVGLEPGVDSVHGVFLRSDLGHGFPFIGDDRAVHVTDEEVGGGADPFEFAPVQREQTSVADGEHRELDARRAGIEHHDDLCHTSMFLLWRASRRAIAQDAIRLGGLSARLVSAIGTLAPSTMPAPCARPGTPVV